MGRLNDAQRNQAIGMITGGMSYREVARRMNCSHQTISRLVERHTVTGSVDDRPRLGRQRVTSARDDRQIVLSHLRDRFKTASQAARELNTFNNQRVSRQTVSQRPRERDVKSF